MHAIAPLAGLTDFSKEALELLRDPSQFKWYTVTFISFAMYVYANEVERENWSAVLAGLALWCADWINEIVNGLVLHFTDRAAIWTTTGETSYLILIGLTIEISFMFLVAGVIFVKSLPKNRTGFSPAEMVVARKTRVANSTDTAIRAARRETANVDIRL